MKYKWLNKQNSEELIIFFNGWGMDESVVNYLNPENYDIIMLYDYNNLEFDWSIISNYSKKHIVAWSMGVMCATLFNLDVVSATAINGTLKPIDNEFGIPNRIYDLTVRGFNLKGRERFINSMFDKPEDLPIVNREFEEQKSELSALKNYQANMDFKYNRVIISDLDKIIPTKNQEAFWGISSNLHSGHCPFKLFKSWSELL